MALQPGLVESPREILTEVCATTLLPIERAGHRRAEGADFGDIVTAEIAT
jgi:hypothetical protein